LKGRFDSIKKLLDVGCGNGRNLVFFLRNGFEVFGFDRDRRSILLVQRMAAQIRPDLPMSNFVSGEITELPYAASSFDALICNAVLHFANDERHFDSMIDEIWRVLSPGGLFFCRLASSIGLASAKSLGDGRYLLPDGTERFLVDEKRLLQTTERLSGKVLDPIKTTNVQNLRCMTTWCLRKESV
jgi:SAM-dependent methyltransferase